MSEARSDRPYLSVLVASRNDNHGGDMLRRMSVSVRALLDQLHRFRIPSELLLVDWNPPADRPLTSEVIEWPTPSPYWSVRQLAVPRDIHAKYPHSDKFQMFRAVAINAAIRRSRGSFVLPGTIDALYSDALMEWVASRCLSEREMYRVDRFDVSRDVLAIDDHAERLRACPNQVVERLSRLSHEGLPNLHTNACGDFQLLSRLGWEAIRGYRESDVVGAHCDSLVAYAAYAAGFREVILEDPCRLYHVEHPGGFTSSVTTLEPLLDRTVGHVLEQLRISPKRRRRVGRILRKRPGYQRYATVRGVKTMDWMDGGVKLCREMVEGRRSYVLNGEDWGLDGVELAGRTVIARTGGSPPDPRGPSQSAREAVSS